MNSDMQREFFAALDEHWDDYPQQFKAARQEITEGSIHDLRVAARRFQARLAILRALDSHPRAGKIGRYLKRLLARLDGLHDSQVMLQEAAERAQSLPQLGRFRDHLQKLSNDLASIARRDVLASKPSDLKQRVQRLRKVAKGHFEDEDLSWQVLQVVDLAYAKTMRAFRQLDASDPYTIHPVRIAFKKFRYMVEAVCPLLPGYPEAYRGGMHDYQEAMGKVHDTMVFLDALGKFGKGLSDVGQGGIEPFAARPLEVFYQNRLDELVHAYFQRKDEIRSYWRASPDQPFPWEKSHEYLHRAARNRGAEGQRQRRRAGQPAAPDRRRSQEVPQDRRAAERPGDRDRPDPDQSVPAGS